MGGLAYSFELHKVLVSYLFGETVGTSYKEEK